MYKDFTKTFFFQGSAKRCPILKCLDGRQWSRQVPEMQQGAEQWEQVQPKAPCLLPWREARIPQCHQGSCSHRGSGG